MLLESDDSNIYLLGFMGAGKSTIGRLLAARMQRAFVDLDAEIEESLHLTIPAIFERFGETYFRQIESEFLLQISQRQQCVVATGGGIVLLPGNRAVIRQTGRSIYLSWPIGILVQRLRESQQRPLLRGIDEKELWSYLEGLLAQRQPYYKMADIIIHGQANTSPQEIVALILQQLSSFQASKSE